MARKSEFRESPVAVAPAKGQTDEITWDDVRKTMSEKRDDEFPNVVETTFHNLGATDLDEIRSRMQGVPYTPPTRGRRIRRPIDAEIDSALRAVDRAGRGRAPAQTVRDATDEGLRALSSRVQYVGEASEPPKGFSDEPTGA